MSGDDHEVEAALLARRDGEAVLDAVAALTQIGPYRVESGPTTRIRDSYFDKPDRELGARRFALRLRETNGDVLLTLKGAGTNEAGGLKRLEVERPWSQAALDDVLRRLQAIGVETARPTTATDPRAALEQAGFEPLQERETDRRISYLLDPRNEKRHLAEIDIDSVTYHMRRGPARLYEVEIEAKEPTFDLKTAIEPLLEHVDGLAPWRHSKLATGLAIDQALADRTIELTADAAISEEGFDELERRLGR